MWALYGEYLYYSQDLGSAVIVPTGVPPVLDRQTIQGRPDVLASAFEKVTVLPGKKYTPEDALRILWHHKWLVVVPFAVAIISATVVARRLPSIYRVRDPDSGRPATDPRELRSFDGHGADRGSARRHSADDSQPFSARADHQRLRPLSGRPEGRW